MEKGAEKKKRVLSGRGRRAKGAGFEREIAHALADLFPHAKRGLGQARAGNEVPDVTGTDYWIECKRQKQPNIRRAYKQATDATASTPNPDYKDRPVVVVTQANAEKALVTVSLDLFLTLLRKATEHDDDRAPVSAGS
jgi:hypothetical protein